MILTIHEIKRYLKIEHDEEDTFLQSLVDASEEYVKNATGKEFTNKNNLAKLLCKTLVYDWYENRGFAHEGRVTERTLYTVNSILAQLKYCEGE